MWSYEDLADREAKRALMWDDLEWQEYVKHSKASRGGRLSIQQIGGDGLKATDVTLYHQSADF